MFENMCIHLKCQKVKYEQKGKNNNILIMEIQIAILIPVTEINLMENFPLLAKNVRRSILCWRICLVIIIIIITKLIY